MARQLNIALFTREPLPEWLVAVKEQLEERGHQVIVTNQPANPSQFDCGWVRVLPDHHFDAEIDYWQAAVESEAAGLPLLNSVASRHAGADKMVIFERFRQASLPTPDSWLVGEEQDDYPLVCKPRSGSQGRDVVIVASRKEAEKHQRDVSRPCLLQQIVATERCIRVVASPIAVAAAYQKKADADQFVLSVALGAERQKVNLDQEIEIMAQSMVAAIGADLAGCDILEDDQGNFWALEINPSFAFDSQDETIVNFYADQIIALAD